MLSPWCLCKWTSLSISIHNLVSSSTLIIVFTDTSSLPTPTCDFQSTRPPFSRVWVWSLSFFLNSWQTESHSAFTVGNSTPSCRQQLKLVVVNLLKIGHYNKIFYKFDCYCQKLWKITGKSSRKNAHKIAIYCCKTKITEIIKIHEKYIELLKEPLKTCRFCNDHQQYGKWKTYFSFLRNSWQNDDLFHYPLLISSPEYHFYQFLTSSMYYLWIFVTCTVFHWQPCFELYKNF